MAAKQAVVVGEVHQRVVVHLVARHSIPHGDALHHRLVGEAGMRLMFPQPEYDTPVFTTGIPAQVGHPLITWSTSSTSQVHLSAVFSNDVTIGSPFKVNSVTTNSGKNRFV